MLSKEDDSELYKGEHAMQKKEKMNQKKVKKNDEENKKKMTMIMIIKII